MPTALPGVIQIDCRGMEPWCALSDSTYGPWKKGGTLDAGNVRFKLIILIFFLNTQGRQSLAGPFASKRLVIHAAQPTQFMHIKTNGTFVGGWDQLVVKNGAFLEYVLAPEEEIGCLLNGE